MLHALDASYAAYKVIYLRNVRALYIVCFLKKMERYEWPIDWKRDVIKREYQINYLGLRALLREIREDTVSAHGFYAHDIRSSVYRKNEHF